MILLLNFAIFSAPFRGHGKLCRTERQTLDELRKDFEEGIVKRPTKPRHKETEAANADFRFLVLSLKQIREPSRDLKNIQSYAFAFRR